MVVSKEDAVGPFAMGCQRHQTKVVSKEDAVGPFAMGCQRHQTKVASHTAVPLGTAKWLVRDCL